MTVRFDAFSQWSHWSAANPAVFDPSFRDAITSRIRANGFIEPLTGRRARPWAIRGASDQFREGLDFRGVKSRERAILHMIARTIDLQAKDDLRVYAAEAISPFAGRLRRLFPRFVGSEFTADPAKRAKMGRIRFEDLTQLSFQDGNFDLVITNEVLEHLPDLDMGLREIRRVLTPGGWHIGTHPFRFTDESSEVRTRLSGGQVAHLLPAEYHVNPFEEGGSLVFEVPGWDILERCKASGFSDAAMYYCLSERHGCVAEHSGGVFVLTCRAAAAAAAD